MAPEEIPNPVVEGPRIMIATVLIGISTGFIFLVSTSFEKGPSMFHKVRRHVSSNLVSSFQWLKIFQSEKIADPGHD